MQVTRRDLVGVVKPYQLQGRDYVRALVRHRDEYACQDCSLVLLPKDIKPGRKSLDVHHRKGLCGKNTRGYDRVKDMELLITLCHSCHFKRHDFSKDGKERMHRRPSYEQRKETK